MSFRYAGAVFWLLLLGLIAFCVAFGVPFLSAWTSGEVVAWAGCQPAGFDHAAVCPPGSFFGRFAPLTYWITSIIAPFFLVERFWDILLGWVFAIVLAGIAAASKERA